MSGKLRSQLEQEKHEHLVLVIERERYKIERDRALADLKEARELLNEAGGLAKLTGVEGLVSRITAMLGDQARESADAAKCPDLG